MGQTLSAIVKSEDSVSSLLPLPPRHEPEGNELQRPNDFLISTLSPFHFSWPWWKWKPAVRGAGGGGASRVEAPGQSCQGSLGTHDPWPLKEDGPFPPLPEFPESLQGGPPGQ